MTASFLCKSHKLILFHNHTEILRRVSFLTFISVSEFLAFCMKRRTVRKVWIVQWNRKLVSVYPYQKHSNQYHGENAANNQGNYASHVWSRVWENRFCQDHRSKHFYSSFPISSSDTSTNPYKIMAPSIIWKTLLACLYIKPSLKLYHTMATEIEKMTHEKKNCFLVTL